MHQYLKAIGFGPIKKKAELKEILEQTRETFTHQMTVSYNEEADYCEFQGIRSGCGDYIVWRTG